MFVLRGHLLLLTCCCSAWSRGKELMAKPKQGYTGAFLFNLVVIEYVKGEVLVLESIDHS